MFRQTIEVAAEPVVLFDLTQDYARRLDWDPFLKEARLLGGADEPGVGVRAWCVAWYGFGMETVYVTWSPPAMAAVRMTRGPALLAAFAGAWRFAEVGRGLTRVTFRYHLKARPHPLEPPGPGEGAEEPRPLRHRDGARPRRVEGDVLGLHA